MPAWKYSTTGVFAGAVATTWNTDSTVLPPMSPWNRQAPAGAPAGRSSE